MYRGRYEEWAARIVAALFVSVLITGCLGWALTTICPRMFANAPLLTAILFAVSFISTAVLVLWLTTPSSQHPNGRCIRCRYDLTGNLSGVCPECGTPTGTPPVTRRNEEIT